MRLRHWFYLITGLLLGSLIALIAIQSYTSKRINHAIDDVLFAQRALESVMDLNLLSNEAAIRWNARIEQQWEAKTLQLATLIEAQRRTGDIPLVALNRLQAKLRSLTPLFNQLKASYTGTNSNLEANPSARRLLVFRLSSTTKGMASLAREYANHADASLRALRQAIFWVNAALIPVFGLTILTVLLTLYLQIFKPLNRLKDKVRTLATDEAVDGQQMPIRRNEILEIEDEFDSRSEAQFRTQKQFEVAEQRMSALFEGSPYPLILFERSGNILLVNKRTELLLGYQRDELLGNSVKLLAPHSHAKEYWGIIDEFLSNPSSVSEAEDREIQLATKSGKLLDAKVQLSLLFLPEGLCTLAAIADISDLKNAEREILRSNKDLEQFAYVASHDLQEPLRMVSSFTGLIENQYGELFDDKGKEYFGYVREGAERMRHLISGLLSYSRIGRGEQEFKPVDLNDTMLIVRHNLEVLIKEHNVELNSSDLPVVQGIETLLVQVFQNLVVNGIKFNAENPRRIDIITREEPKAWEIDVVDNGIGIETKYQERIFTIFQRLNQRSKYDGSGIGLSVAKKIMEVHGGNIRVTSEPGQGSTFTLTFPKAA